MHPLRGMCVWVECAHLCVDVDAVLQEYFIIPTGAATFSEAMEMGTECYHHLKVPCRSGDILKINNGTPTLDAKSFRWSARQC